jgi:septum formation protein
VLASASPRRARILESLGIPFRVRVAHVDESLLPAEDGALAAERLARLKALVVSPTEALPVLAADTLVLCDGRVLGKPGSAADARAMLRGLAGRSHEVVTGVCLVALGHVRSAQERTTVSLGAMSDAEIEWYVATGEPLDKAGAYHVDGLGALFVASVQGSPSNVEGLPVRLVSRLAAEAGVRLFA